MLLFLMTVNALKHLMLLLLLRNDVSVFPRRQVIGWYGEELDVSPAIAGVGVVG